MQNLISLYLPKKWDIFVNYQRVLVVIRSLFQDLGCSQYAVLSTYSKWYYDRCSVALNDYCPKLHFQIGVSLCNLSRRQSYEHIEIWITLSRSQKLRLLFAAPFFPATLYLVLVGIRGILGHPTWTYLKYHYLPEFAILYPRGTVKRGDSTWFGWAKKLSISSSTTCFPIPNRRLPWGGSWFMS